jgi:beta-glucosidase/6-phospho-beta-glucosidase/beta-galactosidase
MNLDSFRFSLSWSCIFPNGVDEPSPKGVQFYHNMINTCLENDI